MKITKSINPLTEQETYSFTIKQEENLDAYEIAECFKKQYPKVRAVISFARITSVQLGLIFVGLGGFKR